MPKRRWLAEKLALAFAAVGLAATLLGAYVAVVISAQLVPFPGEVLDAQDRWQWFDMLGPAFAAHAVFGLALGIAAGAVIGRTYPAMALTGALYIGIRVAIGGYLRPHYQPLLRQPLIGLQSVQRPPGQHDPWYVTWVYRDSAGHQLSVNEVLHRMSGPTATADNLAAHGITGWVYYQPADRFWTFQGIEAALFLVLAALLVGLTWYWVTRRTT